MVSQTIKPTLIFIIKGLMLEIHGVGFIRKMLNVVFG